LARGYGGDNFAAIFRAPQLVAVFVAYSEFTIDTDELLQQLQRLT
jgi:hypothetical protein